MTTKRTPRAIHHPAVQYISGDVAFNSVDPANGNQAIATGVTIGAMPKGAKPLFTHVHVTAEFNAGSTNVLTVGTNSSSYDNLVAAASVNEATTGAAVVAAALAPLAAAADVYAKYAQTGTAASGGAATITVAFIPKVY